MRPIKFSFGDPVVLLTIFLLFSIGVFVLYTTVPLTESPETWLDSLVVRQLIFGGVSFGVLFALIQMDLQISKTLIIQIIAILGVVLLLGGLFFLGPIVNKTHRWYQLGQFLFQPSEFAKIVLAGWAAFWVTNDRISARLRVVLGGGGVLLALSLVLFQPDFGATAILGLIVATIVVLWALKYEVGRAIVGLISASLSIVVLALYSSQWLLVFLVVPVFLLFRVSWRLGIGGIALTAVILLGLILGPKLWKSEMIPTYVKTRVESFVGAQEESFQVQQSKIAIGSGQLWGKGISQGTQSRLRFLPEYTTDFIYSAFVEERGFSGMLLLLSLYLLLFGRLLYLSFQVQDEYSRLIIIGLTVKLWFETFLNIGMNMGALPTKGVALPFMSYGGSSLLANAIIIGIILSLYRYEAKRDTISPSFGLA